MENIAYTIQTFKLGRYHIYIYISMYWDIQPNQTCQGGNDVYWMGDFPYFHSAKPCSLIVFISQIHIIIRRGNEMFDNQS